MPISDMIFLEKFSVIKNNGYIRQQSQNEPGIIVNCVSCIHEIKSRKYHEIIENIWYITIITCIIITEELIS